MQQPRLTKLQQLLAGGMALIVIVFRPVLTSERNAAASSVKRAQCKAIIMHCLGCAAIVWEISHRMLWVMLASPSAMRTGCSGLLELMQFCFSCMRVQFHHSESVYFTLMLEPLHLPGFRSLFKRTFAAQMLYDLFTCLTSVFALAFSSCNSPCFRLAFLFPKVHFTVCNFKCDRTCSSAKKLLQLWYCVRVRVNLSQFQLVCVTWLCYAVGHSTTQLISPSNFLVTLLLLQNLKLPRSQLW